MEIHSLYFSQNGLFSIWTWMQLVWVPFDKELLTCSKLFNTERPRTPLMCLSACLPVTTAVSGICGADKQQNMKFDPTYFVCHQFHSTKEENVRQKSVVQINFAVLEYYNVLFQFHFGFSNSSEIAIQPSNRRNTESFFWYLHLNQEQANLEESTRYLLPCYWQWFLNKKRQYQYGVSFHSCFYFIKNEKNKINQQKNEKYY